MRRVRSTLKEGGFPILVVAAVNLFLVLCVCVLLPNHLGPHYGFSVQPQESHFVIGSYNRDFAHIVSVAPGDTPRLYVESELVRGGYDGFEKCLESWKTPNPSRVSVILVLDKAVSSGVAQRLTDMILSHGYTCSYAAVPAIE
ncbi:MAG: hypothetical protein J6J97_00740 [Akkermansia sp.]|nr:hypothetical protein [Akkermansia sp.]MBQ8376178.1 hypothetical protein [Akkermansia sp.]